MQFNRIETRLALGVSTLIVIVFTGYVSGERLSDRELAETALRIAAIGESEAPTPEDAQWLLEIINSSNLTMHEAFLYEDEHTDTIFATPSHSAIWSLSKILENPPYTYGDENWRSNEHLMFGERKRWIAWSNANSLKLRSNPRYRNSPANLTEEKARQEENRELYMELSYRDASLSARGEGIYFLELVQLFVEGRDLPGDPALFAPHSSFDDPLELPSKVLRDKYGSGPSYGNGLRSREAEGKVLLIRIAWPIIGGLVTGVALLLISLRCLRSASPKNHT